MRIDNSLLYYFVRTAPLLVALTLSLAIAQAPSSTSTAPPAKATATPIPTPSSTPPTPTVIEGPCLTTTKDFAQTLQGFAAVLAVIGGAAWFWRRRQTYPRATLTHDFTVVKITDSHNLLHIKVTISNAGHILLRLVSAEARVQQILPLSDEFQTKLKADEDIVPQNETEAPWPLLKERKKQWRKGWLWRADPCHPEQLPAWRWLWKQYRQRGCEIEPGEKDEVDFDFVLDASVKTVEVYTYFHNAKKRGHEVGWCWTTIYEISPDEHDELAERG